MKIKLLAVALYSAYLVIGPAFAEDIQTPMKDAYGSFKALQEYMRNSETFKAPENSDAIQSHLENLKLTFHNLNEVNSAYKEEPGFAGTLNLVTEMLKDAAHRFREGKKDYTVWRLRTLSNHCASCHVNYDAKIIFKDLTEAPKGLSNTQKAQFFLSTRQFSRAKDLLLKALAETPSGYQAMNLLRQWLVVEVKTVGNPGKSYGTLRKLIPDLKLPRSDIQEVEAWALSLKKWADEPSTVATLMQAENILRASLSGDMLFGTNDPIGLLRGTAMLHSLFARKLLQQRERAKALYLLGLGYSSLSLFVIDEMPEMYLELCIEEFEGTKEAKEAFELYEQIVVVRFSGSGGVQVPPEVAIRLMELYKKAHGIPAFDGKV